MVDIEMLYGARMNFESRYWESTLVDREDVDDVSDEHAEDL